MMVDSEIGVETTRSGPNSARKSLYWPHSPPRATSSPSTQTRSIAPHFLQGGAARRLDQCDFDHATAPVSCTSSNATLGLRPRRRVRLARAPAAISAFASSMILPSSLGSMPRSASTAPSRAIGSRARASVDLLRRPPGGRIGRGVAGDAIGAHMQEMRAVAAPHGRDCDLCRIVDRHRVVAVDRDRRDAERLGALDHAGPRGHAVGARERRDAIVLAHEQHRQLVQHRPVQPLEERPAIDRAVAEHAGRRSRRTSASSVPARRRPRSGCRPPPRRSRRACRRKSPRCASSRPCRGNSRSRGRTAPASCASGRRPWRWRGRARDGSR